MVVSSVSFALTMLPSEINFLLIRPERGARTSVKS